MELRYFLTLNVLFSFLCCSSAFSVPAVPRSIITSRISYSQRPLRQTLDDWIHGEERIALDRLLANVKPGGVNVQGHEGVLDGTIVASPSKDEPDYWYQCTIRPLASISTQT